MYFLKKIRFIHDYICVFLRPSLVLIIWIPTKFSIIWALPNSGSTKFGKFILPAVTALYSARNLPLSILACNRRYKVFPVDLNEGGRVKPHSLLQRRKKKGVKNAIQWTRTIRQTNISVMLTHCRANNTTGNLQNILRSKIRKC